MPRSIEFEDRDNPGFPAPPGAHITRDMPIEAHPVIVRDAPPKKQPAVQDAEEASPITED